MDLVKKAFKLHAAQNNILFKEGTLSIKNIPHQAYLIKSKTEAHNQNLNLSTIFTSRPQHLVSFKNKTFMVESDQFHSKLINWNQYHTISFLTDKRLDTSHFITKIHKVILKKDLLSNISISCLTHRENIQLFVNNNIIIETNLSNNEIFLNMLTKPRIFTNLNTGTRWYLDSLKNLEENVRISEIDILKQIFIKISFMDSIKYEKMLNLANEGRDGLLEELIKENFSEFLV